MTTSLFCRLNFSITVVETSMSFNPYCVCQSYLILLVVLRGALCAPHWWSPDPPDVSSRTPPDICHPTKLWCEELGTYYCLLIPVSCHKPGTLLVYKYLLSIMSTTWLDTCYIRPPPVVIPIPSPNVLSSTSSIKALFAVSLITTRQLRGFIHS